MTPKEAIDNLEYLISEDCTDSQFDFVDEVKFAIEALEKQIPKKPIKSDREIRYCEVWKCPKCGFEWSGRVVDYCYKCGQAIDWGEEE